VVAQAEQRSAPRAATQARGEGAREVAAPRPALLASLRELARLQETPVSEQPLVVRVPVAA
jgi:hypothetical protein